MARLFARVLARRHTYLALLELRLEATRRPALWTSLTRTLQGMCDADVARHTEAGLPGGADTVRLLHHVMEGFILEQITVPDALRGAGDPATSAAALTTAVLGTTGIAQPTSPGDHRDSADPGCSRNVP